MQDFWRTRSWGYFLALAPLVIGTVAVLLPLSLSGLLITLLALTHPVSRASPVPFLLTPVPWLGPMGLYGLWSVCSCWLALLWPGWLGGKRRPVIAGLLLGLAAAAFGRLMAHAGHASYVFAVYAILVLLFLRGLLAWRAEPAGATAAPQAGWIGPGSVLLAWIAAAGLAIPWLRYAWPFADPLAQQAAQRQELHQAFLDNPFAKAICANQPDTARSLLQQQPTLVHDGGILRQVLDQCLDERAVVGYAALKTTAVPIVLDAILSSERQNGIATAAGCTSLQRGLLYHLYVNRDLDGVQLLLDHRLRIDCMADYVMPSQPIWWMAVTGGRVTVDQLQRLQAMGIDLKTPNERGDQFPDEGCGDRDRYPAPLLDFLRQQGFTLQGPRGVRCEDYAAPANGAPGSLPVPQPAPGRQATR